MTNEQVVDIILSNLGWTNTQELNSNRYSNTLAITSKEFVTAIINAGTVPKAAILLGKSSNSINSIIQREFIPIFGKLNGGGETWKFKLLSYIEFKTCSSCHKLLPFNSFDSDICSPNGKYASCKVCRKEINATSYKKDITQDSHKRSQAKNYSAILARNALYRADRNKRAVLWADQEKN